MSVPANRRHGTAPGAAVLCALSLALAYAALAVPPGHAQGLAGAPSPTAATGQPHTWVTYRNTRFGTTVDLPMDWFTVQPPPADNAGRGFRSKDGRAELAVYGEPTRSGGSARTVMERDIAEGDYDEITYRRRKGDWYVLSGYLGERIFYKRVRISHGGQFRHTLFLLYPREQKGRYDGVVERMSRSLSVGAGSNTP